MSRSELRNFLQRCFRETPPDLELEICIGWIFTFETYIYHNIIFVESLLLLKSNCLPRVICCVVDN